MRRSPRPAAPSWKPKPTACRPTWRWPRTRELLSGGNASREVFEQRQAAAQMAGARVDSNSNLLRAAEADRGVTEAVRRELLVRLARTEVRAPVAGLVSRRTARTGAVVRGAGDPLFRIIEGGAIELEADVPEVLLAKLRPGQPGAGSKRRGGRGPARCGWFRPR